MKKNSAIISFLDMRHSPGLEKDWINTEDENQAALKKTAQRKEIFLSTRALLRSLLYSSTQELDWKIISDQGGKPHIFNRDNKPGPNISISHTKNMIACALSTDNDIGIDIEEWRKRDFRSISRFSFGPNEHLCVEKEGTAAFYRIWTLREAIAKMTGEGLSLVTNGIDFVPEAFIGCYTAHGHRLYYMQPAENCSLAVSIKGSSQNWSPDMINIIDSTKLLCKGSG